MLSQPNILYLAALLMDMAVAAVVFAISRRAAELGASAHELGLLGGVWIGTYAALALVTGRVSDRIGRRQVAVAGCVVAALMAVACAVTTRVPLLLMWSAGFGVGLACFWPSVIAWLGEGQSGAALAGRLTRFSVAWNFGLLLGFAYSGVAFKRAVALAFGGATATILVVAALLMIRLRAAAPAPDSPGNAGEPATLVAVLPPKGRGFRKTAWLANFTINFITAGTAALFPQLATELGIGADVHAGLLALSRAAALAAFVGLNLVAFWRSRLWPLWVAQIFCAAGIFWIGLAEATWMFAAAWVMAGAVSGYTYQASIFFTLEEMTEKGKGSGFHEAILGSGMFLGPLLAGWVGNHQALRTPYFFCAAAGVVFVAAQIVLVLLRRRRAKTGRAAA